MKPIGKVGDFGVDARSPRICASVAPANDSDERRFVLIVELDQRTARIPLTTVFAPDLVSRANHILRNCRTSSRIVEAFPSFDEGKLGALEPRRIFVGYRIRVADAKAADEDVGVLAILVALRRQTSRLDVRVKLERLVHREDGDVVLKGLLIAATSVFAAVVLQSVSHTYTVTRIWA